MTNRLNAATSPYLLQHADNPVEWWPWCQEALDEAQRRDVPILLSIGYSACHWCHVMAHESFEDPATAAIMNENFVNIKVDREERPDIDAIYMTATQAMTGQGGWPMTCFLTPEGEPFHCGTYYPAQPKMGMPSFTQLMQAVVEAWRDRQAELREAGGKVVEHLAEQTKPLTEQSVTAETVDAAVRTLHEQFDESAGGFGSAPKFPPSMVLEFLLRHHERTGSETAMRMVTSCAEAMARGGIYDQLGGGFARYSVDANWIVPHFEKMLYDNALLLRAYAHLARRTGSELATRVAEETAWFLLREMRTEQGAFAASFDADTDGSEGLTYVWTPAQLVEVLGEDDGRWAAELFGVTEEGTFEEGASTLRLLADPDDVARWRRVRSALHSARSERPQPDRDDKVLTEWNGLAITALAEAGTALGRQEFVDAASDAARFLLDRHADGARLVRTSRDGVPGDADGVLGDYSCLAEGLLALHQATGEARWLAGATSLLDTALERFAAQDSPGTFYDTADDAESLVHRPSDPGDNASPSGASALASALLTASALAGAEHAGRYRDACESALRRAGVLIERAPRFAGTWLSVAEAAQSGPVQVAVVGSDATQREPLHAVAASRAPGGSVVLAGVPDAEGAPLLADRPTVDGAPAAYVCEGYVCQRPVTTPDELAAALT
ncbi:thioredoxin domain-containing protein [Haloechinothrix sp. YIM 98757]|uniref:Thioredoxin domain-containing protein n=1 Tax=Haloechinothrix aidingensis TaxID=2752311 RepID=A0A838A9L8_9PSEU|nr:thioredoxin domain-containing protein [Haloechinothrix aidingensis]MBA0125422.1 thioredoxin domain-containing protein [Haloechinothrix aidingensis]